MTELNDKIDFEEAYTALQEVAAQLENPRNKIEENIALYERACKLVLHCRRKHQRVPLLQMRVLSDCHQVQS